MLRACIHYGFHFIAPLAVGYFLFPKNRLWSILILMAGILIDIDHLLASPVFDPLRCSINFHPLHSYEAIFIYTVLLLFKKSRIFGIALLLHILADLLDCGMLHLGLG